MEGDEEDQSSHDTVLEVLFSTFLMMEGLREEDEVIVQTILKRRRVRGERMAVDWGNATHLLRYVSGLSRQPTLRELLKFLEGKVR